MGGGGGAEGSKCQHTHHIKRVALIISSSVIPPRASDPLPDTGVSSDTHKHTHKTRKKACVYIRGEEGGGGSDTHTQNKEGGVCVTYGGRGSNTHTYIKQGRRRVCMYGGRRG